MTIYHEYRRDTTIWARPYEPGEDMTDIHISTSDFPPKKGGLIAIDPEQPLSRWYIPPTIVIATSLVQTGNHRSF